MKFIHLRNHESVHEGDNPHMEPTAWGGVTIGYEEAVVNDKTRILYTMARCNPLDNFNKHVGRVICEGRFRKNKEVDEVSIPAGLHRNAVREILVEKYYEQVEAFQHSVREYVY
jgi:hypothetical protein